MIEDAMEGSRDIIWKKQYILVWMIDSQIPKPNQKAHQRRPIIYFRSLVERR
jgi:hypothetical protein